METVTATVTGLVSVTQNKPTVGLGNSRLILASQPHRHNNNSDNQRYVSGLGYPAELADGAEHKARKSEGNRFEEL